MVYVEDDFLTFCTSDVTVGCPNCRVVFRGVNFVTLLYFLFDAAGQFIFFKINLELGKSEERNGKGEKGEGM